MHPIPGASVCDRVGSFLVVLPNAAPDPVGLPIAEVRDQIRRLIGKVEQKGFTLVPLNLHYKGGRVKAEIALAKGKAQHDKRHAEKERDWNREKQRLMRHKVSSTG
mgnify:CR=1 FL=1